MTSAASATLSLMAVRAAAALAEERDGQASFNREFFDIVDSLDHGDRSDVGAAVVETDGAWVTGKRRKSFFNDGEVPPSVREEDETDSPQPQPPDTPEPPPPAAEPPRVEVVEEEEADAESEESESDPEKEQAEDKEIMKLLTEFREADQAPTVTRAAFGAALTTVTSAATVATVTTVATVATGTTVPHRYYAYSL